MANQTIKASIVVGMLLVGIGTNSKDTAGILDGCRKEVNPDGTTTEVCPKDLGLVAFEPKDNGAPDGSNGEEAGGRYRMNVNGVPYILVMPQV